MSHHAHLIGLHELLAAFLTRPVPGLLVVGCTDFEILHLVNALDCLDQSSPADRFLLHFEPFTNADAYIHTLVEHVALATDRPPTPAAEPVERLRVLISHLLDDLPHGDHRLVIALAPTHIEDPESFASLAEALIAEPLSRSLRLILRDDLEAPHHLRSAEAHPSDQVVAYRFHMLASTLVESVSAVVRDPTRHPDERAQALLQLAGSELAHGHNVEAVEFCEAAAGLAESLLVLALALAFRADALHAHGAHDLAFASARGALDLAIEHEATPIVLHASMTLAAVCMSLGRLDDAADCYAIAEQSSPHNPAMQSLARERRLTIRPETPC